MESVTCPKCNLPCLPAELTAYGGVCENCDCDRLVAAKTIAAHTGGGKHAPHDSGGGSRKPKHNSRTGGG